MPCNHLSPSSPLLAGVVFSGLHVFVDMAYKLVGELSPFSVSRLVTRNSTVTLENTGSFFCSQFPAGIFEFEGRLHSRLRLFHLMVSCIIHLLCDQRTRPLFGVTSLEE